MSDFETTNTSDGTVLRGQIWEAKTPKAVLSLVHGFGEHSGRYADMASYLNARGISGAGKACVFYHVEEALLARKLANRLHKILIARRVPCKQSA